MNLKAENLTEHMYVYTYTHTEKYHLIQIEIHLKM